MTNQQAPGNQDVAQEQRNVEESLTQTVLASFADCDNPR